MQSWSDHICLLFSVLIKLILLNTIFLTWQLLDGEAEMLPGPGLGDGNIPPIGGDLQKSSFVSAGRNWRVVGKLEDGKSIGQGHFESSKQGLDLI